MGESASQWQVAAGSATVTAIHQPAPVRAARRVLFVCAHGAGGHRDDGGMVAVARELCRRGIDVVRFNFPYRERNSGRPDPMPVLQQCIAAVALHAARELSPALLILGGRSMGGRAASMLAARGFGCDGLLLLAYPLHPAGQPEKLRDAHLRDIGVPVLCLNGTRDSLCVRPLMDSVVRRLNGSWTMHWLEGADHGFHVLKRSGRSDDDVMREIGEASEAWVAGLRAGAGRIAGEGSC
jgi:uncharacterized protein